MDDVLNYGGVVTKRFFLKAHWIHVATRGWTYVLVLLSVPAIMNVFAFAGSFGDVDPWWHLKWSLGYPVLMILLQHWQWSRLYQKSLYASGPIEGDLSSEGLTTRFAKASSTASWAHFVRAHVAGDVMLLYQSPNLFTPLSRNLFAT